MTPVDTTLLLGGRAPTWTISARRQLWLLRGIPSRELSLSLSELSLNIQDLDLVSCCGPLCYVDSLPFLLSQTTRKLFSLSSLLFLFLNCALYINFFPSKSIPHFRNGCGAGAAHTNTHTHLVPELEETAENIFVFFF